MYLIQYCRFFLWFINNEFIDNPEGCHQLQASHTPHAGFTPHTPSVPLSRSRRVCVISRRSLWYLPRVPSTWGITLFVTHYFIKDIRCWLQLKQCDNVLWYPEKIAWNALQDEPMRDHDQQEGELYPICIWCGVVGGIGGGNCAIRLHRLENSGGHTCSEYQNIAVQTT